MARHGACNRFVLMNTNAQSLSPTIPDDDAVPPAAAPVDWRRWMTKLGTEVRGLRHALGLTQEELAALAGVSQGAVSRLETGRALATPLLVVVRVHLALLERARSLHRVVLSPELTAVLDHVAEGAAR